VQWNSDFYIEKFSFTAIILDLTISAFYTFPSREKIRWSQLQATLLTNIFGPLLHIDPGKETTLRNLQIFSAKIVMLTRGSQQLPLLQVAQQMAKNLKL
jgi:hypothetical protein